MTVHDVEMPSAGTTLARSRNLSFSLPWTVHWSSNRLPLRCIRRPARHEDHAPPWPAAFDSNGRHANGEPGVPFHFSQAMRRLCADLAARTEPLYHIDVNRLIVGVTQARSIRPHGLQAKVTPMRFQHGQLTRRRRGRVYQVQRYFVDGVEALYLVTFCLPRFLDQSFEEKLVTVVHELYHIAPEFNGDLRRHGGRYCLHTRSQRTYDQHMAALVREYLQAGADPALYAFLRLSFRQLESRHGQVIGHMVPVPKLIPLS